MAWIMRTLAFAATALLASPAFAETCAISGEHAIVGRVRVATSAAPLTVHVVGVAVTAYVDEWAKTMVEVKSPLFFSGTPIDRPSYTLNRSVESKGGVARLPSDEKVLAVRVRHGEVIVDVELDRWMGILARDVPVPCDALTLDWPRRYERQRPSSEKDDGTRWAPTGRVLTFHEHPGGGLAVRLEMKEPSGVALRRFRDDSSWLRPWVRVEAQIGRAVLAGWVARSAIMEVHSGMIWGGSNDGGFGCPSNGGDVPATIEGGAGVYAEPGKRPWAVVQASDAFSVRDLGTGEWVQIVSANGIQDNEHCPGLSHAFVRRSAVVFPARAGAISP
jgi:hypothetical protein